MNKPAVMLSIKPQWCELIANGKKTIEVRKTRPKNKTPFKCYIYCTKGRPFLNWHNGFVYVEQNDILGGIGYGLYQRLNGKVIGEFVCDEIYNISKCSNKYVVSEDLIIKEALTNDVARQSCLDFSQINKYLKGAHGYAWHISDLVIYDTPKELSEFIKFGTLSLEELEEDICDYCLSTNRGESKGYTSPTGYHACEGYYCEESYETYLEENNCYCSRPPQSYCYVEEV